MAAVRQFITGTISDGTTAAFLFNTLSGTGLYYFSVTSNTGQSVASITDTQSNTWTQVDDQTVGAFRLEVWKTTAGSAAACELTVDLDSFVSAARIWIAEVYTTGTLTTGATATHDQSSAQDPMTLASLTASGDGIAIVWCATDTSHTFGGFTAQPFHDMDGGANSRAGWGLIENGDSVAPTLNVSTTETGESMILALYDSGGAGGGEHSHVFVG